MYVMQTCPDCEYVEKQVEGNPDFEVIDIGKHVRNLKHNFLNSVTRILPLMKLKQQMTWVFHAMCWKTALSRFIQKT